MPEETDNTKTTTTTTSSLLFDDELIADNNRLDDDEWHECGDDGGGNRMNEIVAFDIDKDEHTQETAAAKNVAAKNNINNSVLDSVTTVERGLSNDTYSLLYVYHSPYKSTFIFAFGIFSFQSAIYIAMMIDILDPGTSNPLRIPPGCSTIVRIIQTFALMVALMMNDDIVGTISEWNDGYKNMNFSNLPPGRNYRRKWLFGGITHFIEGLLALTVNFILIMQSTKAKQLILTLSTTAIISKVDNFAFALASLGYVSQGIQNKTEQVKKVKVRSTKVKRKSRLIFVVLYALLLTGWAVIMKKQRRGEYIAGSFWLAFGTYSYIGYSFDFFSGVYDIDKSSLDWNERAVYLERNYDESTSMGRGKVFYCKEEGAWVFTIEPTNDSSIPQASNGKCHWFFRTNPTKSYAVTDFPTGQDWLRWTGRTELLTDSYFRIIKTDCSIDGDCYNHGVCGSNRDCICDSGWYGALCQFESPCKNIETRWGDKIGETEDNLIALSSNYTASTDVETYGLPIYYYKYPDVNYTAAGNLSATQLDIIYFTGRRWFGTKKWFQDKLESPEFKPFKHYHAQWSDLLVPHYATSAAQDATPVGLPWYRYFADGALNPLPDTVLDCTNCTKESGYEKDSCSRGECLTNNDDLMTNQCECINGYSGPACEVPPTAGTDFVHFVSAVTVAFGGSSCRSCFYEYWTNQNIFNGDCTPMPFTDPIIMKNGDGIRFALNYNGTHLNVYTTTDDILFKYINLTSHLFQMDDWTSVSNYYQFQREMCNESIATLVNSIEKVNSSTALGTSFEVSKHGKVNVLVDHDTTPGIPSIFEFNETLDRITQVVIEDDDELCPKFKAMNARICYTPGAFDVFGENKEFEKAWLHIGANFTS